MSGGMTARRRRENVGEIMAEPPSGARGRRILSLLMAAMAVSGVTACASVMGNSHSIVQITTNPTGAQCKILGRDGFSATVTTPAELDIPHRAAPARMQCAKDGFRLTTYTLDTDGDGWVWGNGALAAATGGIALLGAMVDADRGAGEYFADSVTVTLPPTLPRPVRATSRNQGVTLETAAP